MINNVQITINLELLGMSTNQLLNLINKINKTNGKISFEELEKMFIISGRDYFITTIEMPDLSDDKNDFEIKTAKIEING